MRKPMVSVVMITYGHENYIIEAIEGVLKQQHDFEIELIIANDNSPDQTDLVVANYLAKNKVLQNISIKYFKHDVNKGMMSNFIWTLNYAEGKYIALCEGDDYWTDSLKLQKQVDFMEKNLNYSMCFHKVNVTLSHEGDFYEYDIPANHILSLNDILRKHYIATCSLVFRNGYFNKGLPSWFAESISGDLPLEILLASNGLTKYLDDSMACYRRNPGSITQSVKQIANIRSGYIFMYSKLVQEIKFPHSLYLYFLVFRLRVGYLKVYYNKLKSLFLL